MIMDLTLLQREHRLFRLNYIKSKFIEALENTDFFFFSTSTTFTLSMARTHEEYQAAGFGISFSLPLVVFAVLFYLMYHRPKTFYRMIQSMFSIKYNEATTPDGIGSIDLYGVMIDLPATVRGFIPRFALVLMTTATLTAAFILFFSEIILVHEYLPPNSKLPVRR